MPEQSATPATRPETWFRDAIRCQAVFLESRIGRALLLPALLVGLSWGSLDLAAQEPPRSPAQWLQEAQRLDAAGKPAAAERAATAALAADEDLPEAYYVRGRARFCLDRMDEALADFDRYIRLRPDAASRQWERGIACYYAGKYAEGDAQFRLYQTYHDNDVENSVWRFLCMARTEGVEAARRALLPIRNDRRVPMMEIYRMFRGEATPQQVLEAVERDAPDKAVRSGRLFYARLYVGLYYEAVGEKRQAEKYIGLAAGEHSLADPINGFMWRVAEVHHQRLNASPPKKQPSGSPPKH
jgi:lipoprotein NlpI